MQTLTGYYTAEEAAKILGIKYHTLLSRTRKGKYECLRHGQHYMYPKKEINQHAEKTETTRGSVEKAEG